MKTPFFSIITCTFNSAKYLKKNIQSVEKQTFNNYEHIFIDGNSIDFTNKMIDEYAKKNHRVSKYSQNPRGISAAMNEGIRKTIGKYIIHLNSDDSFYNKSVLENVAKYLTSKPEIDWIYGKISVVDEEDKHIGIFPLKKILQLSSKSRFGVTILNYFNFVPHQATFLKKKVFNEFGLFDESLSSKMDPDMWMRIAKKTKWEFFDQVISNYMVGDSTQTSSLAKKGENEANYLMVQKRYLNSSQMILAKIINWLVGKVNKIYKRK